MQQGEDEKMVGWHFSPQFGVSKDNFNRQNEDLEYLRCQTGWERLLQSKSDITLFAIS
jgi:hypothetical protein